MINAKFYFLLHELRAGNRPRWTIEKIAAEIYVNRSHLTDVLNNKPGHGAQTRPKLIKFFKAKFRKQRRWQEILEALGWDENGCLMATSPRPSAPKAEKGADLSNVGRATFPVEQTLRSATMGNDTKT